MARAAAKEEDSSKYEKTDDREDLDGGEPELRLGICANWKEV